MITGATGHLGRVISETLAQLGANLIFVDQCEEKLENLSAKLKERYKTVVYSFPCDLEDQESRQSLIEKVSDLNTGLDILINNAAFRGSSNLEGWSASFHKQSVSSWQRAIEVNMTAVFEICQGLSHELSASGKGVILNIGSIYGSNAPNWEIYKDTNMSNPAAYAASKGGLIQFSRWLATTLAPKVRVNVLSPGGIYRNQPEVFVKKYESITPMGRMATEQDFAGSIAYLCSDASTYLTGQNIIVDGGWGV